MPSKYPQLPTSHKKAKAIGTLHYMGKRPCKLCGVRGLRYTSNGRCVACSSEISRRYYATHKELHADLMSQWREEHPDYHREYMKSKPEKGVAQVKYANRNRLDPNWSYKDDLELGALLKERKRLEEETGYRWRLALGGSKVFKLSNVILVQSSTKAR